MTAAIPRQQQSNRDSLTVHDALAVLAQAGFTITGAAEWLGEDGTEVRVTFCTGMHPMVRIAKVISGVRTGMHYEDPRVVDGVARTFDNASAAEFAVSLIGGSTTWAVTR